MADFASNNADQAAQLNGKPDVDKAPSALFGAQPNGEPKASETVPDLPPIAKQPLDKPAAPMMMPEPAAPPATTATAPPTAASEPVTIPGLGSGFSDAIKEKESEAEKLASQPDKPSFGASGSDVQPVNAEAPSSGSVLNGEPKIESEPKTQPQPVSVESAPDAEMPGIIPSKPAEAPQANIRMEPAAPAPEPIGAAKETETTAASQTVPQTQTSLVDELPKTDTVPLGAPKTESSLTSEPQKAETVAVNDAPKPEPIISETSKPEPPKADIAMSEAPKPEPTITEPPKPAAPPLAPVSTTETAEPKVGEKRKAVDELEPTSGEAPVAAPAPVSEGPAEKKQKTNGANGAPAAATEEPLKKKPGRLAKKPSKERAPVGRTQRKTRSQGKAD